MMDATILGCGVSGSWSAYFLALSGYNNFVLFDGGPVTEHLARLGPYPQSTSANQTAAQLLAEHLRRLDPSVQVEVNGHFDPNSDSEKMKGTIVGAMGLHDSCSQSAGLAKRSGHTWITL